MKNNKKIEKILFAETLDNHYYPYQNWYFPLKRACKKIIHFDTRKNYFIYGKEKMNKLFLEYISAEQPDYIFMWVRNDEFNLDTFLKIRERSSKTKTFLFFGDDDAAFENFSRYYILFLDYGIIAQHSYIKNYKKEGHNNVFFAIGLDTHFFKPLNLKKKYDVTFIGHPKTKDSERYHLIKFLKDNGINLKLFGWGWDNYPEFKDIYGGPLESEKMVEVLNQSKINLCLSKNHFGKSHLKGKVFEGGACKTFVLTEFCEEYLSLFKEGKDIVTFRNKEELLKKIRYYLDHEKEREQIAENAYKKILKDYSLDKDLQKIFKKLEKNKEKHISPPKIHKKIITLSKKEIFLSKKELINKIENYDYISFSEKGSRELLYKNMLQSYSLEKTQKPISCCNYYVDSPLLGNYLYFFTEGSLRNLSNKDFNRFIRPSQIMVTKKYFLENKIKFEELFSKKNPSLINSENTALISLPLVQVSKIPIRNYPLMKKAFEFQFLYPLLSIKLTKRYFSLYPLFLILEIFSGKFFILTELIKMIKNKDKRKKVINLSNYV